MSGIRRIFYDKLTGNRIQEVGRDEGFVIPTIEYDIATYTALSERNRETFDVLELPFGALVQNFIECTGYRVDVTTKTLVFSYPDPNNPEAPPVYQKPLTEQISEVKTELKNTQDAVDFLIMNSMPI